MSRNFGLHPPHSDPRSLMAPGDSSRVALWLALTLLVAGLALLAMIAS